MFTRSLTRQEKGRRSERLECDKHERNLLLGEECPIKASTLEDVSLITFNSAKVEIREE